MNNTKHDTDKTSIKFVKVLMYRETCQIVFWMKHADGWTEKRHILSTARPFNTLTVKGT